jgi:D-glycero-D-manno-heptose 1,7-bisphosphate phosphatase
MKLNDISLKLYLLNHNSAIYIPRLGLLGWRFPVLNLNLNPNLNLKPPEIKIMIKIMIKIREKNRAIFFDRDGTLIEEKKYLHRPEDVAVLPGAAAALRRLSRAGFRLFIVSNQSGVGRGWFTLDDVAKVNARLAADLASDGARFDKIYIAPEAPDQPSRGRKPSPQFLLDARDEFGLRLEESCVVGDKMSDLECGWKAGVKKSILVRTGYGRDLEKSGDPRLAAALIVDDLAAAADWILSQPN